jgi:uncharacterized membrane protein
MLGLFKRKPVNYFSEQEKLLVKDAIEKAEHRTSGEIRVFVERHCKPADPVLRAKEVFQHLKMYTTAERNGVLVYVAMENRKLAVFGDEGIHTKVGDAFWQTEVTKMLEHFNNTNYAEGIVGIIREIGEALATHFPYDEKGDVNELPDDIVFGN